MTVKKLFGSVPYHQPSGSGTPRRKHTPADRQQESRIAAEAYALATPTSRQSGARPGPTKLNALLASKLATGRAWELKETFTYFWHYKSVFWAGGFLDYWLRPRHE
jgi:hypothetical protein